MPAGPKNLVRLVDILSRRTEFEEVKRRRQKPAQSELAPLQPEVAWAPGESAPPSAKRRKNTVARFDKPIQADQPDLPAGVFTLPERKPVKSRGTSISFLFLVVLPVFFAAVYYYGFASNQYSSQFRFAVRNAQASISGGALDSSSILGAVTGSAGSNALENYMVVEYLVSAPGVEELQKRIDIRSIYSIDGIDRFSRLDPDVSLEKLVTYWRSMTRAAYDQVTGITTVQVRTFRPEDALLIAQTLTDMAEELITRIAHRPQQDAVRFAEGDLKRAENRLKVASVEMMKFRDTERVIEPTTNVVSSNTQLVATLRASLSQLQMTLATLVRQNLSPTSPARASLEARIRSTKEQLATIEGEINTPTDSSKPISRVVGQYEDLDLERTFAQDVVKSALRNLETARGNALLQHMYVVPFVEPVLPQSATYPDKFMSTFFVAVIALLIWSVGLLMFRSVREHIA